MSSKIIFRYGAMGSGKSSFLIGTYYNYLNLGKTPIVIAPSNQSGIIKSRSGASIPCTTIDELNDTIKDVDVVLVDEAQFLSEDDVSYLLHFNISFDVPIIAYGLKTDSAGELFEGSKEFFRIADKVEELPTLCPCGHKARFNLRFVYGKPDFSGGTLLREEENVKYVSVCRDCFYKIKNGQLDYKNYIKFDNSEV